MANQAAANRASEYNATNAFNLGQINTAQEQAARVANQAAANRASEYNATNAFNLGQFNTTQEQAARAANQAAANAMAQTNLQAKLQADLANQTAGLNAQQATAQYGLQGFQANEEAKRALASGSLQAGSTNVQNALSARTQDLNAIQQGMQGAQGLGALEAQYQNTLLNQANLQNQIAAQDQAYQQAIINDAMAAWDKLQGTDAEKAKMLSSIIGMLPGGTTSVKVSS